MNKTTITLFLLGSIALGICAGYFLTALALVLIMVVYALLFGYLARAPIAEMTEETAFTFFHITIVLVVMWATAFVVDYPDFNWVTDAAKYVWRHTLR